MANPSSVKRTPDSSGDDIATLIVSGKHAQVTSPVALQTLYAEVSPSVAYLGQAEAGTLTSAAAWRIRRITTSGGDVTVQYADGNTDFDNVWTARASLSYS